MGGIGLGEDVANLVGIASVMLNDFMAHGHRHLSRVPNENFLPALRFMH